MPLLLARLRRLVLRYRRPLAATLAGVAALLALRVVTAPPPATVAVVTTAHDLPAGTTLTAADLTERAFTPDSVPDGALDEATSIGRVITTPMRAGEVITDVRLLQPSLLHGYTDEIALPVRLSDAAVADLLRVGDRVDLVAATAEGSRIIAAAVPVIAIPQPQEVATQAGALIVVAASRETAVQITTSSVSGFIHPLIAN